MKQKKPMRDSKQAIQNVDRIINLFRYANTPLAIYDINYELGVIEIILRIRTSVQIMHVATLAKNLLTHPEAVFYYVMPSGYSKEWWLCRRLVFKPCELFNINHDVEKAMLTLKIEARKIKQQSIAFEINRLSDELTQF